jgi:hypothetical protein
LAGILIVLIRYLPVIALAAFTPTYAQPPTAIPSRVIKVVEFDDVGNTYRVDLESGAVTRTKTGDVVPIPPAPEPPKPEPPKLEGLALRVNEWFRAKVTTDTVDTANELAKAIDVTLAVTGGLNLRGQAVLDELAKQVDYAELRPRLAGFPLGDALKIAVGDDPDKIVPALKDAKKGLEAIQ